MDELFNKVFKNTYLFRIIFNFVQFKHVKTNDYGIEPEEYDAYVETSENRINIDLGDILSKKQYKLFDRVLENYFQFGKKDSIKYWYYVITPCPEQLKQVLSYGDLGFDRFLLLYNEFEQTFTRITNLLRYVIKGGNIKILEYLKSLSNHSFKVNHVIRRAREPEYQHFECSGSLEMYKYILDNIFEIDKHAWGKDVLFLVNKAIEKKQPHFYQLLVPRISCASELKSLMEESFKNLDVQLAQELIKLDNFNSSHLEVSPFDLMMKLSEIFPISILGKHTDIEIDIQDKFYIILKLYLDKFQVGGNSGYNLNSIKYLTKRKLDNFTTLFYYGFNFNEIKDRGKLVKALLGSNHYVPFSIGEFEYIKNNFDQSLNSYNSIRCFSQLSVALKDLQYVVHFYNTFNGGVDSNNNGQKQQLENTIYTSCLNSSTEIVKWAKETFIIGEIGSVYLSNTFFNDLELLELVSPPPSQYDGLIARSISFEYKEMFTAVLHRYYNQTNFDPTSSKIISYLSLSFGHNKFDYFKLVIDLFPYWSKLKEMKFQFNFNKSLTGKYIHYIYYKGIEGCFIFSTDPMELYNFKKTRSLVDNNNLLPSMVLGGHSQILKEYVLSLFKTQHKFLFYLFKKDITLFLSSINQVILYSIHYQKRYFIDLILNNYENQQNDHDDGKSFDNVKFFTKYIYASLIFKRLNYNKHTDYNGLGKSINQQYYNQINLNFKCQLNMDYFNQLIKKDKFGGNKLIKRYGNLNCLKECELIYLNEIGLPFDFILKSFNKN